MNLERKVRFEYGQLSREEAEKRVEEAGFAVIAMKYNTGLFGQYGGSKEKYETSVESLEKQGIRAVYRESEAKDHNI